MHDRCNMKATHKSDRKMIFTHTHTQWRNGIALKCKRHTYRTVHSTCKQTQSANKQRCGGNCCIARPYSVSVGPESWRSNRNVFPKINPSPPPPPTVRISDRVDSTCVGDRETGDHEFSPRRRHESVMDISTRHLEDTTAHPCACTTRGHVFVTQYSPKSAARILRTSAI